MKLATPEKKVKKCSVLGTVTLQMAREGGGLIGRIDSDVGPAKTMHLLAQGMNAAFLKMKGGEQRKAVRFLCALERFAPELFNALAEVKT